MQALHHAGAVLIQPALDLHEAARVVADHVLDAGFEDRVAFHLGHRGRDLGEFYGKHPAESAAGFTLAHLDEFQPFDGAQEFAGGFADAEFAEAVAAVVKGHATVETRAEVADAEPVHEEVGELVGFRRERFRGGFLRAVVEKLGVELFHHRAAGAGGGDDDLGIAKGGELRGGDGAGLVPVAGIEGRLAAAGLGLGVVDLVAEALEDFDHGHADLRVERIDEAGNEKGDAHAGRQKEQMGAVSASSEAGIGRKEKFPPTAGGFALYVPALCMIQVEGLTKLYGDFRAVADVSFSVMPGEIMGLVGPNGAGKTSTLRCLAGIIPATAGAIRIAGHELSSEPLAAKQELAFFSDEPRLFDYLTVRQHLEFTARLFQVPDGAERGRELLAELEMADKADLLPGELSRGMKQKVALACGFVHAPKVMFFDEPLTGLDPLAIRRTKDLIVQRARAGAAVVISSHLLHLLEEVCSHVLILKRGVKIVHGTLEEIRAFAGDAKASLEEVFIRLAGEDAGR